MKLTKKKQKRYVATTMLGLCDEDAIKDFCSKSVEIDKEQGTVIANGTIALRINFKYEIGHITILENIDDYDQCQWRQDWAEKDELITRRGRGFTKLCRRCKLYLETR